VKKSLLILINLFLIGITSGIWILVLIFYLIWKSTEKRRDQKSESSANANTLTKFQGSKFAQDSAKGAVFEYASLQSGDSLDAPYAIIDLETNGLDKNKHRVIEIAVRRISSAGDPIDEIATLIDPESIDIGPTFLHHIKLEDVIGAPKFVDFAPELLNRLSGSIAVAHHAAFEDGFLGAEFARIGNGLDAIPCIDTLWLARQVIDLPNYKLATVLDSFGIEAEDAHTALGDVRLLSKLLPILLDKSKPLKFNTSVKTFTLTSNSLRLKTRVSNLKKGDYGWIANMLRKLPESGQELTSEVVTKYTELLSQFLSDGKITGEEAKQLSKIAGAGGLGADQVRIIHADYLTGLEKLALDDGKITEAEKKQLALIKIQLQG
jgi:DNA polymerase III epsilon subunit-like protein